MNRTLPASVLVLLLLACAQAARKDVDEYTLCTHVIDGGTITVQMGECLDHIRLIGVDAPRPRDVQGSGEPFGSEAAELTRSLVEGKKVRLEFDRPLRDERGQFMAYVYLEDGTLVNAELLKRGFARVLAEYPFSQAGQFKLHERSAREARLGIWRDQKAK